MTPANPSQSASSARSASARRGAAVEYKLARKPRGKDDGQAHHWLRELADELFFVFVIVMFFKLFLVDLYKIPSGSMTPTLIGGLIADVDTNEDGRKDLVFWMSEQGPFSVLQFVRRPDGRLVAPEPANALLPPNLDARYLNPEEARGWLLSNLSYTRFDRILVNKVSYWFKQPRRGEIVVFKVPPSIWREEAPIYIKRLAGEPGDTLTFDPRGRLIVNGERVEKPAFYATQYYRPVMDLRQPGAALFPGNIYEQDSALGDDQARRIAQIHVPQGSAYVFGDNTLGSLDSRYWGGVPLDHFKGRAFFRVWPLAALGRLR